MKETFTICIQCQGVKVEDTRKCCGPRCLYLRHKAHLAEQWAKSPYRAKMLIEHAQMTKLEADKKLARDRRDAMGPITS